MRLRRDLGSLLALIRSHAILHQQTRDRDDVGRLIATVDDYKVVRDLVADVIAEGVGATVSPTVRQTVEAVAALAGQSGVMLRPVADRLGSSARPLEHAGQQPNLRHVPAERE